MTQPLQQGSVEVLTGNYLFLNLSSQLNQASAQNDYHDNCRAQWEAWTVTHCPGWGGSSQSLDTKDTLSIGPVGLRPVDTHESHVFINSVRYQTPEKGICW